MLNSVLNPLGDLFFSSAHAFFQCHRFQEFRRKDLIAVVSSAWESLLPSITASILHSLSFDIVVRDKILLPVHFPRHRFL